MEKKKIVCLSRVSSKLQMAKNTSPQDQEKQVRELITWAYGKETYKEMMQMRRDIRAKRERMVYKQRRRQRRMLDVSAIIIGLMVAGGILMGTVSFIQTFGR